jgi:hypothetical protein
LCVPTPLSLGADEVSGGEFVVAAAHHGYFYGKGDCNEVVMSTCLHLFLSVFALGA